MIDYPYIILLLVLFILLKNNNIRSFYFASWIIFIFIACRAPVVGADTLDYVNFFTGKTAQYNNDQREIEPFLLIYNNILNSFTKNGVIYLIINTIFTLFPIYLLIKRYSSNKLLSYILFFILGIYTTYFVALRQIISISFILMGILFCLNENNSKISKCLIWIITTILAYMTHTTALIISLIFILIYFIKTPSKTITAITIITSFTIGYFLGADFYIKLFSIVLSVEVSAIERIYFYLDSDLSYNNISVITILLPNIIALLYIKYTNTDKLNTFISKTYILSVIANNIFIFFVFAQRLIIPFQLFSIIALTHPLVHKNNKYYKLSIIIFVALFSFRYIKSNINPDLSDLGRLHPYYFFFENYNNHPSLKNF